MVFAKQLHRIGVPMVYGQLGVFPAIDRTVIR
jgi:hypothetical protein